MTLDASGNLGIGSTSPQGKLEISTSSGTTIFRSVIASGGTANANDLAIKQDFLTGVAANYLWSNSNYMLGVGRNGGTMPTSEANATALSSFVINSSGNVGIGTTSPASKLHISNNGAYGIEIDVANEIIQAYNRTTSDYNEIKLYSSNLRFFNGTSATITERMRITSGGNVGIGTTNPQANLVVQNTSGTTIPSLGSQGGHFQLQNGTYGLLAGVAGSGNAWMQVQRTDGSATAYNLLLQPSGGNVGIGTTSPGRKLEIASSNADSRMAITNSVSGGGAGVGLELIFNNADASIINYISGNMIFGTNATERMRITSGGNVLVGTTTDAGYKLDVNGTINGATVQTTSRFIVNSTSNSGVTDISLGSYANGSWLNTPSGTTGYLSVAGTAAYSYSNTDHIWYTSTGTERMRITSGGNVGIGTTSPTNTAGFSRQVQIEGTYPALTLKNVTGTAGWFSLGAGSNGDFGIWNNTTSTYPIYINSSNNVGIGTTSPQDKLTVKGATNYNLNIGLLGSKSGIYVYNDASSAYNDLRIDASLLLLNSYSGGNVLVGTATDVGSYKLQVNGNGYFSGNMLATGSGNTTIAATSTASFPLFQLVKTGGVTWNLENGRTGNSFGIYQSGGTGGGNTQFSIAEGGNAEFAGSIKTAAPSGGTAKPWKLGAAGVTLGGSNLSGVEVEIDGTTYYLVTGYLPEPEPDPAALPASGPSGSYKTYNKPTPVKSAQDAKIQKLEKEVAELKEMIKMLMPQVKK